MKRTVWIGFVAFCLWAGSAWLYDLFFPGVLTGLPRTALHNGVVALGCFVWGRWRRKSALGWRVWAKLAAGAAFLFGLPEAVLAGASAHVTQSSEVLVFMLVPSVVVFWVGQQTAGFGAGKGVMQGLVPALAGLGGAVLILPFGLPTSLVGRMWLATLVASAVSAGIAAVAMHRLLAEVSLARAGGMVLGVSGLLTASFSAINWAELAPLTPATVTFECLRLLLVDVPILLLGIWLLREMQPVAFSSRLLLVPAVTLIEGIVAERPQMGWYGWLGLALTVGSGLVLLWWAEDAAVVPIVV